MARRPVHIPKTALTDKKRASLRASDFAVPSERKYPINDLFHARLALTYVLTLSNAAYRDEVVRAVMARYPELQFWWASRSKRLAPPARRKVANPSYTSHISEAHMPVYTLNPSHTRSGTHKASASHSLRERVTLRRNGLSEDGMNVSNPRAKTPTRKDELMRFAHEAGYHVETYSPGDGVTRYRFFDLAEMDRKGVSMREMSYFGPLNGVDTVLGLAAAKKWLSKSHTMRRNGLSEDEQSDERQQREDAVLLRGLGPNVGLNADWNESAYYIAPKGGKANRTSGAIYLNNLEGDDWSLVQVIYDEEEGTSDFEPLKTFGSVQEAVNYISSHRAELERKATGVRANPKRPRYKVVAVAKPRSRSGGTAQKAGLAKGQSLMARAAAAYRAGKYASMQDALRGVARGGASLGGRKNPLSEDGAVVSNPRPFDYAISSGGKTIYTPGKKSLIGAAVAWSKGSDARGKYEDVTLNDGLRLVVRRTKGGAIYDIVGRGRNSGGTAGNVAQAKALSLHYASETPRTNPTKRTKSKAKRSSGRTVAQSNAAKAMKLFHSGQASSLAEAWDMIRRGR